MSARRIVIGALILALSAGVVPAPAFHDPGVPILDEFSSSGTHWVAWRFVLPRSTRVSYEAKIQGGAHRRQAALAEWLVGDNGYWFVVVGLSNPENGGTHLQTIATGVLVDEPGVPAEVDSGVAVNHQLPAGSYTLVLAWDGADSGVGRLYGESVLQVLGRTDGTGATWSSQRDFDGVANADNERVGATVAGNVTTNVSGNLFAMFGAFPGNGFETISYVGPGSAGLTAVNAVHADSRSPLAGAFDSPYFIFLGDPPGRYDFSVLASVHLNRGVTLFTADVTLPGA